MAAKFTALLRWLRFAAIGLSILAAATLSIIWVRSYSVAERIHGRLTEQKLFILASKQGRVTAIIFPPSFNRAHWRWEIRHYPLDSQLSFPSAEQLKHQSRLGFGLIREPDYTLDQLFGPNWIDDDGAMPSDSELPWDNYMQHHFVSFSYFLTLRGTAIILPYWFLVSLSIAAAFVLSARRPWRYSLRTFFIAITLVAILLGMIVALDNGVLH